MTKEKSKTIHIIIIVLLMTYLFTPILGTLIYSVAGKWSTTIIPESFTFNWYLTIFKDPAFYSAMGRTLFVSLGSVLLCIVVMIPTVFVVAVFFPKFDGMLQGISLLRYGIPPVVAAIGLIKLYSSGPIPIHGTFWILIGSYFILVLPFMYQGIRNSIRSIKAVDLMEASELLGAGKFRTFVSIIIPNIIPGIIVSSILSIAFLFGEFVFASLLVGGRFETIPVFLYNKLQENGHLVSAIVVTYYIVLLIITGIIIKLGLGKNEKKAQY